MVQVLCAGTSGERTAQKIRREDDLEEVPRVSMDSGFFGERESEEQVSPVLVIRERRHNMTWTMLVPRKGTEFPWIARRAAKFIDQLGHNRVTRSDVPDCSRESNEVNERAVGLVAGQARTLKAALEHRIGSRAPPDARILC